MSENQQATASVMTAAEICRHFQLGEESRKLLCEEQKPLEFYELLLARNQFPDAVRLLAHLLPKREAVWWACQSAREFYGQAVPGLVAAALAAAERWVINQEEEDRRLAMETAKGAEFSTPAGCAAVAAFWSGNSLAPAELAAVPPGKYLTAQAVSGAVLLSAVGREPQQAPEKYRRLLALGMEILKGAKRWPNNPAPKAV
jgi:hypothetical protein